MTRPALWRHLWRWTLLALAIAWVALMGASYYAGLHEAEEITDAHLASAVNVLLQVSAFGAPAPGLPTPVPPADTGMPSFIPLGRHLSFIRSQAVIVWDRGVIVADSRPPELRWPVTDADGYTTFLTESTDARHPRQWRMFSAHNADGTRRAVALISLEQRAWIGRHVAVAIARPALVVLPLVALLLWWAMRRGLRPLNALSARVATLDLHHGERLEDLHRYAEFDSMVQAINGLITRLETQVQQEKQFASDVAHELRSPLAAIALQTDHAAQLTDPAARNRALASLQQEALRAGRILGELLDLARAQGRGGDVPEPVDLGALAARVLAGFAQASHESGHLLELDAASPPVVVDGHPLLLELAVGNLVANALRHTAAGTRVRVSVRQAGALRQISVDDDGPRVLQEAATAPRAASAGLGLGLTLVERIARLHQAQLLRDGNFSPMTTCFTLCWGAPAHVGQPA